MAGIALTEKSANECFGIGPDHTIWHTSPNIGGWHRMSRGGKADRIIAAYYNEAGERTVKVWVKVNNKSYCSSIPKDPQGRGWGAWYECR